MYNRTPVISRPGLGDNQQTPIRKAGIIYDVKLSL